MEKIVHRTFYLPMVLLIFFWSSCSKENEKGITSTILEVSEQTIDFKENSDEQTITISTNQDEWTAIVDPNAKNWCAVLPDSKSDTHTLTITVSPNKGKEIRTTIVTIKAGELSKSLTVRQLGSDIGILISPEIMTLKAEGGQIDFKITANVEFEISKEDWIALPAKTRSVEYVTTEHTYIVQRNKGEARTGYITVKDKESDYYEQLLINQKALGEYEGGESTIKGDILVSVSGGSAVNSAGSVSQVTASPFSRTYDGNKETGYHSSTKVKYPTDWPLTLTFEFSQQPRVDYCVYYPSSSDCLKEAEIWVSTEAEPEYTKLMDTDFQGKTAPTYLTFSKPLIHPKGVKVVAKTTTGSYLIVKEMEFYRKNPTNFDPLTLFTDATCTTLKASITEKEIDACPDPLFRNIAYYMSIDKYPSDFRIQEYKAYPHPELFRVANKTSAQHDLLDNTTGIFVEKGNEVVVLVGNSHGYRLSARVLNLDVPGEDGFNKNYSYPLMEGTNRFIPETDGLVYIYYHTPDYKQAPSIKIHVPSGKVNGYFDVSKHNATDWNRILNAAVGPHFDVLGKYAHLIFPTDKFKANTPDGKALIDAYDRLVLLEQQFMGLEKYNRMDPNHVCFSVMYNDAYMYSANAHTGYIFTEMNNLCNVEKFSTKSIWGPAHEVGHSFQTKPGLCWHGMGEVTNNIHSLYVQTEFGNTSRLMTGSSKYTSLYEKGMSLFLPFRTPYIKKTPEGSGIDVFCQLVPFWQLHLYSQIEGNRDFYKDLYEKIRLTEDKNTPGESQINFTILASEIAQLDLTEFFTLWGFYESIDYDLNDYGTKRFTVTEAMAEKAKQRIAAMNLPKPVKKIEYICDDNLYLYKANSTIVKGHSHRDGKTFGMTNWKNVAVYEVWSDGKLCFISPASSFTLPENFTLGNSVQVYAVDASGEKTEITF